MQGSAGKVTSTAVSLTFDDGNADQYAARSILGSDEAKREICNDRVNLTNWGFQPYDFAYPYEHYNAAVEQMVAACGYNSAREVGDIRSDADGGYLATLRVTGAPPGRVGETTGQVRVRSLQRTCSPRFA